jgi:hypothetical protein
MYNKYGCQIELMTRQQEQLDYCPIPLLILWNQVAIPLALQSVQVRTNSNSDQLYNYVQDIYKRIAFSKLVALHIATDWELP